MDIAYCLRVSVPHARRLIAHLTAAKLLEINEQNQLVPHDWNQHQYVSDDVTARTRKHRLEHPRNVPGNAKGTFQGTTWEPPQRQSTEAEAESVSPLPPSSPNENNSQQVNRGQPPRRRTTQRERQAALSQGLLEALAVIQARERQSKPSPK